MAIWIGYVVFICGATFDYCHDSMKSYYLIQLKPVTTEFFSPIPPVPAVFIPIHNIFNQT